MAEAEQHDGQRVPSWVPIADAAVTALSASILCALPTAYRTSSAGGGAVDGLFIGCAVLLVLLLPTIALMPKAERGLRGVMGKAPPRSLALGVLLWLGLSALLLFGLAAALEAKTHHLGLGGATFGVFGAALVGLSAVAAGRLLGVGRRMAERGVPVKLLIATAALPAAVAAALMVVALLMGGDGRAALFDLILTFVVVVLLHRRRLAEHLGMGARAALLGVTLLVVVGGFARAELSTASQALKRGGGLPAALLTGLELWSDRDGDGIGAHFGGHDCDEGDPRRHPGAVETAGDGLDLDCDGLEAPAALAASVSSAELVASGSAPSAALPASSSETTLASAAPPEPEASKPDIVLVTLDTVGAKHTSLAGYEHDTTPQLAKLAKKGMLFEHAYAAGSNTQRALMAVISGNTMSATPTGSGEWPRLEPEAETVAERMAAAGYATGAVSGFTWVRKDLGFDQGFDVFEESPFREQHPEHMVTGELTVQYAKRVYDQLVAGAKPIFLWVHFFDAHQKYLEHPGIDFGKGQRALYDGEIRFVDDQLGRLLEHVAAGRRAKQTLWVVHGSHGEAFGEHDKTGHGGTLIYDEVLWVPLVMAGPGVRSGRFGTDAVSILDVAPTLLELAGVKAAKGLAGVSLAPALAPASAPLREGTKSFERPPVMAYATHRTAVIDWPLKLLVRRREEERDRTLLFDLETDPGETHDISGDHEADVRRLNALRHNED